MSSSTVWPRRYEHVRISAGAHTGRTGVVTGYHADDPPAVNVFLDGQSGDRPIVRVPLADVERGTFEPVYPR